jgi:hypothetical protein
MLFIEIVDRSDNLCVRLLDFQCSAIGLIAQRHVAPHPETLLLGRRDLVANALGRNLPLKLGKAQQHVESQPPHACGGIERLGH